jgi:hypothetical protein
MPSWHETTKNLSSLKIKQLPANANLQHTFYSINRTHTDIHSTQKYMQEKLLFVLNGKCLFLQGVLSSDFNRVSAPSLAHSLSLVHTLFLTKMRYNQ